MALFIPVTGPDRASVPLAVMSRIVGFVFTCLALVPASAQHTNPTTQGRTPTVLFSDDFDGNQTPGDLWDFSFPPDNPYMTGSCAPPPTGMGPPLYNSDWYRPETGFCTANSVASNDGAVIPTYSTTNNGLLILGLPPTGPMDGGIELPADAVEILLTFDHHYDFESSFDNWDGGRVRISVDNWPAFQDLTPVGGYPGTVTSSTFFCTAFPGEPAYVGDSGGCVPATFDLTAFAGSRVWINWNHGSDSSASNDQGWAIDNVQITTDVPLPVELVSFEARVEDGRVVLTWETALEMNHAGFEVQEKKQGQFVGLGIVEAGGTAKPLHTYQYSVNPRAPGWHTFRLKQLDFDGSFAYSPEVDVFLEVPGAYHLSQAYPNPFRDAAEVTLTLAQAQYVRVAAYDVLGRQVKQVHEGVLAAQERHRFRLAADGLPTGMYILHVEGETFVATQQVVRVR